MSHLRYAVRTLSRTPGFTVVALVTLALGIGGTTAIFSIVDAVLLRPLPYPDPGALVRLSRSPEGRSFSAADYLDLKNASRSFAALAGFRQDIVDLTGEGDPVRLVALETTGAFFDVFRLPSLAGRTYNERTDPPTGPRVAVISEGLWQDHLGRSTDAIGRVIRLNGVPFTVIGIMPATFRHPSGADLWVLAPRVVPTVPITIEGEMVANRDVNYFEAVGRLQAGIALTEANAELRTIAERLPPNNAGETKTAMVQSLQDTLVGDVRNALLVLLGAVAFVLLIACANVASLSLARGVSRRRELAVRTAVGASRGRLIGQLMTESVMLAAAGGALGVLVAYWGIALLLAVAPDTIPRINEVSLDLRVALFAIGVSAAVGLIFGLAPAFQGAHADLVAALKEGGRGGTGRTGLRSALVVAEMALSLVLLIGAGLMLSSFTRLKAVDPGFVTSNLVVAGVPLPMARYDNRAQAGFYGQLYERLIANPLTAQSALVFPHPFSGFNAQGGYRVEGAAERSPVDRNVAQLSSVSPGYFQTMGIPLLRGRDLSFSDTESAPAVGVINRAMAEREWPGQDPIGKRVNFGGSPDDAKSWVTIIGVVGNAKRADLETEMRPALYFSIPQFPLPYMSVVVRSGAGVSAVAEAIRQSVRAVDPNLPTDKIQSIEEVLSEVTGQPRFRATLVGAFAATALVLAAVGLYGLISFIVAQRVPEIGVRLALGATPRQVGGLVVRQGLSLAIVGVVLGVFGAMGATRLISGLLFSVSATDPVVYSTLAALLLMIAALACYVPARRAMRIDPVSALRSE